MRENALAAAFRDPRFAPPDRGRIRGNVGLKYRCSLPPRAFASTREDELRARLRPGIDGVTLELDDRRATFLPQVWETLPEPRDFLAALKHKAGFPVDFWSPRLNVALYQVTKWKSRIATMSPHELRVRGRPSPNDDWKGEAMSIRLCAGRAALVTR